MLLSFSDLLTMARSVIARLETHGIHVHPASRLQSYVDATEKAQPHEYSMPPVDLLRICHRALSELNDFTEILDVLDTVPMSDAWRHLVRETLGGGVTRSDEKRHMRARDTQFELVVAAFLHRKGCAIQLTEPDIVAATDGVAFAVAAKRPRSRANLERIVRDAGKQIMRSGMQGLIAVDTTVIANLNDEHFVSEDGLEDERLISRQATEHAKDILRIAVKRFGVCLCAQPLSRRRGLCFQAVRFPKTPTSAKTPLLGCQTPRHERSRDSTRVDERRVRGRRLPSVSPASR